MTTSTAVRLGRIRVLVALSTSALALAGVSACGGTDSGTANVGSSKDGRSFTVQFVNPLPSYPTWKQIGDCMKDEAGKRGVDYSESGPSGTAMDVSQMTQQVQQAVANKKGAIITFPANEGFTQVLKQARSAGVVTGTIYGPGGTENGADYNIGPDWNVIGEAVIGAVAALPGKHVVGLVAADNTGLGKSWLEGVKNAVAKHDNVTIGGQVYTSDDAAKALSQVNALLTAHPDITEIVTHMGTVTPGAVSAIKSQGRKGKTFLLAVGHDNGGSEAVKEGTANLMLMQDVCSLGKQLVDGVVDVHEGKTPAEVPVKVAVIGKDDVEKYLSEGWV
jgi:ABC-type sugar transport system substrate-binding protein